MGQDRSINIPAANYLLFGAGEVAVAESWLLPYETQGLALPPGSEAAARVHVPREGIVRRMMMTQTTPTVQPVTYTLEVFDPQTVSWVSTGIVGTVEVGEQSGVASGPSFIANTFDLIRVRVDKAPAEPNLNHVRCFVELA